jgi:hypothetical protein
VHSLVELRSTIIRKLCVFVRMLVFRTGDQTTAEQRQNVVLPTYIGALIFYMFVDFSTAGTCFHRFISKKAIVITAFTHTHKSFEYFCISNYVLIGAVGIF